MSVCCVVDQFCDAPANVYPETVLRAVCFACGLDVYTQCSSRRKYYNYGRVRICNNCQIDYDGHDQIVKRRMYKQAGY